MKRIKGIFEELKGETLDEAFIETYKANLERLSTNTDKIQSSPKLRLVVDNTEST